MALPGLEGMGVQMSVEEIEGVTGMFNKCVILFIIIFMNNNLLFCVRYNIYMILLARIKYLLNFLKWHPDLMYAAFVNAN